MIRTFTISGIILYDIFKKEMIDKACEVLKQLEAYQGTIIKETSLVLIQKRPEQAEVTEKTQNYGVSIQLKKAFEEKLSTIYQKLEELQIPSDIDIIKETGGLFKDFGQIDNVFDEGKTVLAHKPGEVLLVDVWATWCGPCQKPMKHNQEMLQKNQGIWGKNVRIVGVSVDEQKQTIKQRVTSKKWEKVTHLTLLGWKNDHPLIKEFKVSGIPFICLVNKWGKIDFIGHPSQINLEKRINELLAEKEEALKSQAVAPPAHQDKHQKEAIQKIIKVFTKQTVQKEFKDAELASFRVIKEEKRENGVTTFSLRVTAYIADGDHLNEEIIKNILYGQKGINLTIETVKYTKLPQDEHPICALCNTPYLKYPFYWLRWEEGTKFGCRACVQKKSQVEGHHHAYQKNAVLLRGKWQKVGEKDLGKNIQPADVKTVESGHQFSCNGCGGDSKGLGSARYISLGCRSDPNFKSGGYVDLCDECIQKLLSNNQEVIDALKPEGYEANQPFLRILYNVDGYYKF